MQNILPLSILQQRKNFRKADVRGEYYRDTTAIIHSYPFRRLKHKTQVFFAPSNDHICTRIEHVMHVASIASTISRGLGLDNELAWAIGLGHDLGHTPFGHVGETILSDLASGIGGFKHELYSLRVVDFLAEYGNGLNLTYAVRDGIVSHCGESFERVSTPCHTVKHLHELQERNTSPSTWEGSIVRFADQIAYLGRDYEDAVKLHIIEKGDLPHSVKMVLGETNSEIIDTLVVDVITHSSETEGICFSPEVFKEVKILKEYNYRKIYKSPLLSDYHTYFDRILRTIFEYLQDLFSRAGFDITVYKNERNLLAIRFGDYVLKMKHFYETADGGYDRIIIDYVAGMSDNYALDCINEILKPRNMEDQFNRFLMER